MRRIRVVLRSCFVMWALPRMCSNVCEPWGCTDRSTSCQSIGMLASGSLLAACWRKPSVIFLICRYSCISANGVLPSMGRLHRGGVGLMADAAWLCLRGMWAVHVWQGLSASRSAYQLAFSRYPAVGWLVCGRSL